MNGESSPTRAVPARVLAVDDCEVMREAVAFTLRSAGYDVVEACSGRQALELIGQEPGGAFDLVLTDWRMSDMDGLALVRALRANGGGRYTPVVFLTGADLGTMRARSREAGADSFLEKPFRSDALLAVVASLVPPGRHN